MKKFIIIVLTLVMVLGCTSSTFAASSSGKYVKVKKATYQKYKKAYNAQKSYKEQIRKLKAENKQLKNAVNSAPEPEVITKYETIVEKEEFDTSAYEKEIAELKEKVASLENENAVLKEKLGNIGPNDDIDELKHRLSQQEDINDWLWMCFKSLGISYSNKIWTVPSSYPETFLINGTKYKVMKEEE